MQEEYSSKRVGIFNIVMFLFTGIFAFAFSFFTGKGTDLTIRNTIVSLLFCGTVIFMLQDDLRRGEESFYFDNYLNTHRYFIAYMVMVVLSCVFSLISSVLWPYMCIFVILAALSNFEIGLISGIGFVCLSIMLGTNSSYEGLIMYVLAGVVALTLMRDQQKEKGIVLPVFISLLMQAVLIAAFSILFEGNGISGRLFIMPLLNIMVNMVVLFVFLNFMSVYIIRKASNEEGISSAGEEEPAQNVDNAGYDNTEEVEVAADEEAAGEDETAPALESRSEVPTSEASKAKARKIAGLEEEINGFKEKGIAESPEETERDQEEGIGISKASKEHRDEAVRELPEDGLSGKAGLIKAADEKLSAVKALKDLASEGVLLNEKTKFDESVQNTDKEEPLHIQEAVKPAGKKAADSAENDKNEAAVAVKEKQGEKPGDAAASKRKRRKSKKKVLNMTLNVENEVQAEFDFNVNELAYEVAECVLKLEGCSDEVEVELIITDDDGIQELNRSFRDIDSPTDVLSFPNVSYDAAGDFSALSGVQRIDLLNPDTGKIMFGEIVVNEMRVRSQATEYGHSEKREFAFLIAHSMLHLCGYDHMEEEEALVMEEKQEQVLEKLGITRD